MAQHRQQVFIDVPVATVWALVGDPRRHAEWWPRVVDVQCDGLEEGCVVREVMRSPTGRIETDVSVERLDDCREIRMRCLDTGTFTRWLLTEARGGTFVDAEFGIDPLDWSGRIFDIVAGKRYFRRWLEQSVDALREAAGERAA